MVGRRGFLAGAAAGAGIVLAGPAWSALAPTPRQSRGPFYPVHKPVDSDADLVTVAGRNSRAAGVVTHISGRIVDPAGKPVPGALVEIWQCDAYGVYHHPAGGGGRDANFQGYGRTVAGADGGYRFRTIRPVAYPGRAPHIHFAVQASGFSPLTTQMYVAGEAKNERDFLLQSVRDPARRSSLTVPLAPSIEEKAALAGRFDIVIAAG